MARIRRRAIRANRRAQANRRAVLRVKAVVAGFTEAAERAEPEGGIVTAIGVRGLLVYCSDYRCSQSTRLDAVRWADDIRLSDIEPRFVCAACGRRGANVRPDWGFAGATPGD